MPNFWALAYFLHTDYSVSIHNHLKLQVLLFSIKIALKMA
jgi:hypothetical protein